MSVDKVLIKDRGATEQMTIGRAVDTLARSIAEGDDANWNIASRDDRERYLNIATVVVHRHLPSAEV